MKPNLKSMRDVKLPHIDQKLNCTDIITKFNGKPIPSVSYGEIKITQALVPIASIYWIIEPIKII